MSSSQTNADSVTLLEIASLAAYNLRDANVRSNSHATVHRGMSVQTSEGHTAGHVAAIVLDQSQQQVTHVLLVQERQLLEYRLIPVELITQINGEEILLRILQPAVDSLPAWHST
jgi:sporulation protein YlmC with PRC-barrel domain